MSQIAPPPEELSIEELSERYLREYAAEVKRGWPANRGATDHFSLALLYLVTGCYEQVPDSHPTRYRVEAESRFSLASLEALEAEAYGPDFRFAGITETVSELRASVYTKPTPQKL